MSTALSSTEVPLPLRVEDLERKLQIYEKIANNAAEPIFLLDAAGQITFVNDAAARMLDASPQSLIGSPFHDRVHSDASPSDRCSLAALLTGRSEVTSHEDVFLQDTGTPIPVSCSISPVFQNGQLTSIVLTAHDISAQKAAEERQQKSLDDLSHHAAELDAILESIPDAVYVGTAEGIFRCNQAALDMLGFRDREELENDIATLAQRIHTRSITGETIPPGEQPFEHALRGHSCIREVCVRNIQTGQEMVVRCAASPIRVDGKIIGAVAVNTDITDRKRQESELLRSNNDLQQFAYTVGHDLREPMRTISSFVELLGRKYGDTDPDTREFMGFVNSAVDRMRLLIDDVLAYSKAGTVETLESVDTAAAFNWARMNLEAVIKESGATLRSTTLPLVQGYSSEFVQLFQNLIGNAIKYRANRPPEIEVGAELRDSYWVFSVADNGIGIEPQFHASIFGLFKRLHGRDVPGTGVGLALCEKIVERRGGKMWVESTPGTGSTFYFTIPA